MPVTAKLTGPPEADATVIEQSWTQPERFAAIFERYFAQIHQYLARRVSDRTADDLAAEVFVVAFAQRQRYDLARDCARPWLYGIANNMVRRHRREEVTQYRAWARTGIDPVETDCHADQVTARVDAGTQSKRLAAVLAELPPEHRDVLLLFSLADLSYPEIAEALGIPLGTVRSRLHRARAAVRTALTDTSGARP